MRSWERGLRWVAPLLAVAATVAWPALRASAPLLPPSQWTVGQLGAEALHAATGTSNPRPAHPELRTLLRQAQALRQQFAGGSGPPPRALEWALALAALIPVMAIVAGACAWLSLGLEFFERLRRWRLAAGVAGVAATAYAIGASWWLTQVARTQVAAFFAHAQQHFGGLLNSAHWLALEAGVSGPLGLEPQVGLYLLLLAFLAMLALPETAPL